MFGDAYIITSPSEYYIFRKTMKIKCFIAVLFALLCSVKASAWNGDIGSAEHMSPTSLDYNNVSCAASVADEACVAAFLQEDIKPVYLDSLDVSDDWQRKLYIKTNALGWGLLITNLALEVDLARHWTFSLPVYFSGWDYFSPTVKFRTLSFQPEVRYHFNLAVDGEYRLQDRDGDTPAIGGGVAVGYRKSLTKDKRLKMEFSIGGGVYDVHYDRFRNKPNGFLVDTNDRLYIGPDQASVTISYSFNLSKKGGEKK